MLLSKNTIDLLQNYSEINNGIFIKKGDSDGTVISTIAIDKTVYSKSQIPEEFEHDVALYDLPLFLSVYKAFKNPLVNLYEDHLVVSEGKSRTKLLYADTSTIKYPDKEPKLPESVFQFDVSQENLKSIKFFAGTLKKDLIVLENREGKLTLSTYDADADTTSSSDEFTTELGDASVDNNFKLVIQTDTLKLLPFDYSVSVYVLNGKAVAKFESLDTVSKVEYLIPLNTASVWEE